MTPHHQSASRLPEIFRWTSPFAIYLLGTSAIAQLDRTAYPIAYTLLMMVMIGLILRPLRSLKLFQPHGRFALPIFVGMVGLALWIVLTKLSIDAQLAQYLPAWLQPSSRLAFDPFSEIETPWIQFAFIAFRLIGLVAIVPIAEELFWRGFLLRWFVADDWQKVPIGTYSPLSFAGVVALFALAHPEWTAAIAYCALLNSYLVWKRDLWGCLIAHATSNLGLALYVLASKDWGFW
jgi:uncharacterized protein